MDTVMVTDTDITDTTLERGPLMLNPLLMPSPLLLLSPDMLMALMASAMLTVMVLMDTDTPLPMLMDTITAKDLLSPPQLLNPDTVITDTVTVTLTDTDTPMLITVTITAKGLLKPSPLTVTTVMLLMPTVLTVMVMVTVTATVMLMASKFILLSFLSNYYNGCVYKKFYDSENFDLRSTVPE